MCDGIMKEWVWNASFIVQEEFRAKRREVFLAQRRAREAFHFELFFVCDAAWTVKAYLMVSRRHKPEADKKEKKWEGSLKIFLSGSS